MILQSNISTEKAKASKYTSDIYFRHPVNFKVLLFPSFYPLCYSFTRYAVNTVLPDPSPPPASLSRNSGGYMVPNSGHRTSFQMSERPLSQHRKSSYQLDADNDTYSTPVDTLHPSMGTRIIHSKKRPGGWGSTIDDLFQRGKGPMYSVVAYSGSHQNLGGREQVWLL